MGHFRKKIHQLTTHNMHHNLSTSQLIEKIILRHEGILTETGAISTSTGKYTGRSPRDRFIVQDDVSEHLVDWGLVNQPLDERHFHSLYRRIINHLKAQQDLFSFKGYVGADLNYRLPIEVINEYAWHNLFARQLFIQPTKEELQNHLPRFTVLSAPTCYANPEQDGTHSKAFIVTSFKKRIILIGGTAYAGEIKKSIFSAMNFLLPQHNILPMHCSANVGPKEDVALFFGLSGTGKTTLSTDPIRKLIGDDEHGWSQDGIFNIEGGCYAKCSYLSPTKEPQIYEAIKYGAILENVVINQQTRTPLFNDISLTENTRAAYPLSHINQRISPSKADYPKTIFFLTADASGTLPPISRLTNEQAMYYFLSGYTSKLAGTERGISKPKATFSACFGAPFLPLSPVRYAEMLEEKLTKHNVTVFLVNTGWTGGPYGIGQRIKLTYTRHMIHAAIEGKLDDVEIVKDAIFGLYIPRSIPGIPSHILIPRYTWRKERDYDETAYELALQFHENFNQFTHIDKKVKEAGPLFKG